MMKMGNLLAEHQENLHIKNVMKTVIYYEY